jgi:MOSC domain-containing protein YiiM
MSVLSVSMSTTHTFYKSPTSYIYLLNSLGVQGDAHCSSTPSSTNKRQVHLISSELLTSLATPSSKYSSFQLPPGSLGENITTTGIDLLGLGEGSKLHFGDHEGHAVVKITGAREPRKRLDEWPNGLLDRLGKGKGRAKVGVYGVVEQEGYVQAGYVIYLEKGKGGKSLGSV